MASWTWSAFSLDRPYRLYHFYRAALTRYLAEGRGCMALCTAASEALDHPAMREALRQTLEALGQGLEGAPLRARLASATLHRLALRARAGQTGDELVEMARQAADWLCSL